MHENRLQMMIVKTKFVSKLSSLSNFKSNILEKNCLIYFFVNIDQIKDQCYSLVNLTPSDVFCILHIE
jgi:hypothetical protein